MTDTEIAVDLFLPLIYTNVLVMDKCMSALMVVKCVDMSTAEAVKQIAG